MVSLERAELTFLEEIKIAGGRCERSNNFRSVYGGIIGKGKNEEFIFSKKVSSDDVEKDKDETDFFCQVSERA